MIELLQSDYENNSTSLLTSLATLHLYVFHPICFISVMYAKSVLRRHGFIYQRVLESLLVIIEFYYYSCTVQYDAVFIYQSNDFTKHIKITFK